MKTPLSMMTLWNKPWTTGETISTETLKTLFHFLILALTFMY